jgi:hypothetical protein
MRAGSAGSEVQSGGKCDGALCGRWCAGGRGAAATGAHRLAHGSHDGAIGLPPDLSCLQDNLRRCTLQMSCLFCSHMHGSRVALVVNCVRVHICSHASSTPHPTDFQHSPMHATQASNSMAFAIEKRSQSACCGTDPSMQTRRTLHVSATGAAWWPPQTHRLSRHIHHQPLRLWQRVGR